MRSSSRNYNSIISFKSNFNLIPKLNYKDLKKENIISIIYEKENNEKV